MTEHHRGTVMKKLLYESSRKVIKADGSEQIKKVTLVREHSLTISINGKHISDIICTNELLKELVIGFLFTEGYIESSEDISDIIYDEACENADVILNQSRTAGDKLSVREMKKVSPIEWKPEWIFRLAESFSEGLPLHSKTQGTHSCLLAQGDQILFNCEDLGRHNIVDKAVGYALLKGISLSDSILYISGRVPVDIMKKVIYSGIPILVSKAVPTLDAALLAKEYGVTLIVRAYPDQIEICE